MLKIIILSTLLIFGCETSTPEIPKISKVTVMSGGTIISEFMIQGKLKVVYENGSGDTYYSGFGPNGNEIYLKVPTAQSIIVVEKN